jgi:uncharacterized protein (TIGR04141 family)
MAKTHGLTIRLLNTSVKKPEDAIATDLKRVSIKQGYDFSGAIFFKPSFAKSPKWVDFVNRGITSPIVDLKSSQASALLIIKADDRHFAISFGNSWQWLDESKIVRRFGLIVALNCIADEKIKVVDAQQIDSLAKSTRSQVSHSAEMSAFGLDVARDLMRAVSGRPQSADIGSNITGSDALRIKCKVDFGDLGKKCIQLLSFSRKKTYKEKYPWIDNIEPVRSASETLKLDEILVAKINSQDVDGVYLSPPRIRDLQADDGYKFHFDKAGVDPRYDLEIDDLMEGIADKLPVDTSFLKKHKIFVYAGGGDLAVDSFSIYSALVFEAPINNKLYCLIDGDWFKVSDDHVKAVNEQIKKIKKSTVHLPNALGNEKEGTYNERAAAAIGALCLDRKLINYGGGRSKFELCDILTKQRAFIHVKRSASSNVLSHLFNQGVVSGQLMLEPPFRTLCEGIAVAEYKKFFIGDFLPEQNTITYGVISKSADQLPGNLPFFSKQTLVNAVSLLQKYRYNTEILGIKSP